MIVMDIHDELHTFSVLDYIIFVGSLVLSLAIGLYYSFFKKQDTNEDFLMAGRSMSPFPVALSLLASFISAITVLALPAEVYYNGIQFYLSTIASCIAVVVVGTTLMPLLYHLKVTSIYEYLELRFQSKVIRFMATLTFMIKNILYMAVVLYTPALALSVVTPLSVTASILTAGAITTVYTGFGGLRAVLWTDVFQVFMMIIGIAAIVIQGCIKLGGIGVVWSIAEEHGRTHLFDFNPDPFLRINFWSLMIGNTIAWVSVFGCNQTSVQRYLSMRSPKEATWALFANIPMKLVISTMAYFSGLVAFAVYAECDPKAAGIISKVDQIMPYYVMDVLGYITGLPGLFVACVFAASLSSLSSGLNALAAVTWEDFICLTRLGKWLVKKDKSLLFNKCLALSYGILSIGLAFSVGSMGSIIDALLTVFGALTGPVLAAFFAAMFLPWYNRQGLTVGMLVGFVVCIWLALGSLLSGKKAINPPLSLSTESCPEHIIVPNRTVKAYPISPLEKDNFEAEDLYRITYLWYPVIGLLVTILLGIPISIATGNQDLEKLQPDWVHPWMRSYLERKQKSVKDKLKYELNAYLNKSYTGAPE